MTQTHTQPDSRIGAVLAGRYRLDSRLAAGGMAVVYRATDQVLGRQVAVKIMHPALAYDGGFVERFRREAQNAARLNHANIAMVHDWGHEDETVFMVMELVEGTSLREMLDRFGRLDQATAKAVVSGVAAALDHAHARSLVHRDVKPENVLITPDGGVKVVDFGVARALGPDAVRLTTDGALGTVAYIAPEQLTDRDADARADVYALGVMTYEMLTGRAAFTGETPSAVAAARLTHSVPSPGVSPQVDGAVARATALRPEDRFESAGALADALGGGSGVTQFHETQEVSVQPVAQPTTVIPLPGEGTRRLRRKRTTGRRARRRLWPWLALLLVLSAGAAGAYEFGLRTTTVPQIAGLTEVGAEQKLQRAELRIGPRTETFHDTVPAGTIVSTSPESGQRARPKSEVAVVVSKGPEMLRVPSVVGKPSEQARTILTEDGFTVGEESESFHNSIPAGSVAAQDPAEGKLKRGAPIALVVSKGPDLVPVPQGLSGVGAEEARRQIRAAGFAPASVDDFSDTVAEGRVIRTDPAGAARAVRGSKVTVVVSKGPRTFAMPSLVGMTAEGAKQKIKELGLVLGREIEVPGSASPKGQVQGQNPSAGTQVRKGAKADIYVAG
ncbi:MAG TPA: Stk1 family PASTA domain-containing Ser/Thr kinase [Actinomycetota bacterium]|nr:Stk1 family PASTA domain-containing Ser/Thr kinase [Actinomycetota bacterium]